MSAKTLSRSCPTPPSLRWYAPISRFSRTVSRPSMPRPSGTSARPRRTSSYDASARVLSPPSLTSPLEGRSIAAIALSVVVLPAPFAPIRHTSSPSRTSRSTPFTAAMPP